MLAACVSLLAGCAATPVPRSGHGPPAASIAADAVVLVAFAPDFPEAKLTFHQMIGVAVDGEDVASLGIGTYTLVTLAPGRHRLAAHHWMWPGRCPLTVELSGGTRVFAEIRPWFGFERPDAGDGATGGRTAMDALALLHPMFDFWASMLNPCGGFTIALVDEETATARIASLPRWP